MKGEVIMKFDKIKEILKGKNINFKDKKVQAISGVVAGALIIAVVGTMILHNNNIENNNVAIEKNIEDKTSEDDVLEEINEELEVENTVEDKEITENTDEHIHDENCNHDEENSTSQESNQEVAQNSETANKQEVTTESSSDKKATTTTQTSTSNSNKNDSTNNSNTNKTEHTHSWVEVYKDVYHAEEGHYENVLVKEAWTESVPVYTEKEVMICNDCGIELNANNCYDHVENHLLNGGKGSWREEWKKVQTGTNTINHDAVYEQKWVVDKQAWTEKVLSGYKCNSCGATK